MWANSDPILVAAATPVTFPVGESGAIQVQVRFYTDAQGREPLGPGLGSRDVVVQTQDVRHLRAEDAPQTLVSDIPNGAFVAIGGKWALPGLGYGAENVIITATSKTDDAGALSYRILTVTA